MNEQFFSNENNFFSSVMFLKIITVCVQKTSTEVRRASSNLIAQKRPKFMRLKCQSRFYNQHISLNMLERFKQIWSQNLSESVSIEIKKIY